MNLFSSERNQNWLIWIWCIKFHLFLWKLSDVFIAINRFANKFNIYINFVQLCYQFHPPNVLLALFFHAIVLPLSGASLDLWGCRLSSKRGSFSHGGLILCLIFPQRLDFVLGVDPKVSVLLFHCYLGCGIIGLQWRWHYQQGLLYPRVLDAKESLQNLFKSTTVLHYFSATKIYATIYLFVFIHIFIDTKIFIDMWQLLEQKIRISLNAGEALTMLKALHLFIPWDCKALYIQRLFLFVFFSLPQLPRSKYSYKESKCKSFNIVITLILTEDLRFMRAGALTPAEN